MTIDFELFNDDELAYLRKGFVRSQDVRCPVVESCDKCHVKDACKLLGRLYDAVHYEQETRDCCNIHK